jgi:hypothetical protein
LSLFLPKSAHSAIFLLIFILFSLILILSFMFFLLKVEIIFLCGNLT